MPGPKLTDILDKNRPWLPSTIRYHQQMALKNLEIGNASPAEQVAVLRWIVEDLCRTYDQPYFADSPTDTAFAAGKMYVGEQIRRWLKTPMVPKDEREPYDDSR